jgi:hypothetical protein
MLIGTKGEVLENKIVSKPVCMLGKRSDVAWQNEGTTQNVYESKRQKKLTSVEIALMPEC